MKNNKSASQKNLFKMIAIGSSVAVLLLICILVYIFWYQNPNKVASDALLNTIAAKNITTNGNTLVTLSGKDNNKITIKTNTETNGKNTQAKLNIVSDGKTLPTVEADAEMKMTTDGAFYIRLENLSQTIENAFKSYADKAVKQTGNISEEEKQQYQNSLNEQLDKGKNTFKSIDNEWIRFSVNDMTQGKDRDVISCQFKQIDRLKTDSAVRKEIGDIFNKNQFVKLVDAKDVKSNGNSKAYTLEYNKDQLDKFGKAFGDSNFSKDIDKKCGKLDTKKASDDINNGIDKAQNNKDTKDKTKFNIWIDRFSHKVTSIQVKTVYDGWSVDAKTDVKYGNVKDEVKMPSDQESVDFSKVMSELNKDAASQY